MLFPSKKLPNLHKQKGAALVVALFVVALVAAAATFMIERLRTDIRRTELILNANAAHFYAQGAVAWAIDTLNNNVVHQQQKKVIDRTPIRSPNDTVDGYTIASTIYDAQGKFNINNLSDQQYHTNFTRLITSIDRDTNPDQAKLITDAIIDWISPTSTHPELDEYYLKLNPSYRAAHRLMASSTELRLVKGVTPQLFKKLATFVTALPRITPINVNNAEAPVLMSLSMTLSQDSAKAIVAVCRQNPFATPESFLAFEIVKNNPIDATKITVLSNYFLLETNVTLGNQNFKFNTLLERIVEGKKAKTVVVWQSKGTL